METSWDRQADETDEWYDRFTLYLYMGPERTIAAAHSLATRVAQGAALGRLSSWRRAAQRHQWRARAAAFDGEMGRRRMDGDVRAQMVAELLQQVYAALRHAELQTMSKDEARQLLPTFRLFFRDLLRLHQHEDAQQASDEDDAQLTADDLQWLLTNKNWRKVVAELRRASRAVDEREVSEVDWRPLRDVLAQLYPDEASARRMAAQADLDVTRILFSPRAVDSWHAILTEAAHAGQVEALIAVAQQEYGTNPALAKAVRHYRRGDAPAQRPAASTSGTKRDSTRTKRGTRKQS